jgi:YidC/Oxa1 family membrane protein insertase
MISDWSGVALEFAFGLERPVLFMDIPRKINNPHYQDISCLPLEDKIRSQIGEILNPEKCSEVSKIIEKIKNSSDAYREKIQRARSQYVFNVGKSGAIGAQAILDCLTRDKIGTGNE